jgi:hypothetical protein
MVVGQLKNKQVFKNGVHLDLLKGFSGTDCTGFRWVRRN